MKSITFRGAHVRYFDGRQEEGGAFVRIHMTAEFSDTVVDEMQWEDPGHSATDTKLEGELMASNFILTPGDKALSQYEIQFGIRSVEDFKMVRVADGESKRRELRFTIRSSAAGVAAMMDDYIRRVGDHQGSLKVSYAKEEQEGLDLRPAKKESAPEPTKEEAPIAEGEVICVSCNNNLPLNEAGDFHTNGTPCKNAAKHTAAPLASAAQMGAATRVKKMRHPRQPEAELKAQVEAGRAVEEEPETASVQ